MAALLLCNSACLKVIDQSGGPGEAPPLPQEKPRTSLDEMKLKATGFPIYVDANVAASGDGTSWKTAFKSVGLALKRALLMRKELETGSTADKTIYIIVAGGRYSYSHENAVHKASGEEALGSAQSLVRLVNSSVKNIHFLGGYASGDLYLELERNQRANPVNADKRETILDGENKSDNVILINGSKEKGLGNITISGFTVTGGKARKYASDGGAFKISGSAHDIEINHMKFIKNSATGHGGCMAITDAATNITIKDSSFSECMAEQHGGAIAMTGTGLSGIELASLSITNNRAGGDGGGVAIFETGAKAPMNPWHSNPEVFPAPRFMLLNNRIDNNRADAKYGEGGGVAIFDNAELVEIKGGSISSNQGHSYGGGVNIEGKVHMVTFDGVTIEKNTLESKSLTHGGGINIGRSSSRGPESIKIWNTKINGHKNIQNGAGLRATRVSGLWLGNNTSLTNNEAKLWGGGADIHNSNHVFINSVLFEANSAEMAGGAMFWESHIWAHNEVIYRNNSAIDQNGGAIAVVKSFEENMMTPAAMPMSNIICEGNSARDSGGCAYITKAPGTIIDGGSYQNNGLAKPALGINNITSFGGAIYYSINHKEDKLIVNKNARFSGNQAETDKDVHNRVKGI